MYQKDMSMVFATIHTTPSMKNGTISVYWQANESGTMRNLKYSIKLGGTCSSFRVMSNSINVIVFVIYNTVFVFKKYYTLLTTLF